MFILHIISIILYLIFSKRTQSLTNKCWYLWDSPWLHQYGPEHLHPKWLPTPSQTFPHWRWLHLGPTVWPRVSTCTLQDTAPSHPHAPSSAEWHRSKYLHKCKTKSFSWYQFFLPTGNVFVSSQGIMYTIRAIVFWFIIMTKSSISFIWQGEPILHKVSQDHWAKGLCGCGMGWATYPAECSDAPHHEIIRIVPWHLPSSHTDVNKWLLWTNVL